MLRVKICGLTNLSDARHAVASGADALGFVFADSPRRANADAVKKIMRVVGSSAAGVGVFVDESIDRMLRTAERCGLDILQLHGDEKDSVIRAVQRQGFQVLKAFRVHNDADLKKADASCANALLFDTSIDGRFGGTGQTFDWEVLRGKTIRRPWFVSGGLDPKNVTRLLKVLTPYGLDVSSGVESSPGKKDHKRVKEFIKNAKSA